MEEEKGNKLVEVQGSPLATIHLAVEKGLDLEKVEKALILQERWEANEARKAYHVAMSAFKENPPQIEKDKTVSYVASGKTVTYNHASLANVVEKITAELSKHGLSVSWNTKQNGAITVTCKITHVLGHSEETTLTASADTTGSKNSIQAMASTITYLQRYTVLMGTGLATDENDDDGRGSESKEVITEKQLHTLRDLLLVAEGKEAPLCKHFEIEKLDDLPSIHYQRAVAAIEAKKKGGEEK